VSRWVASITPVSVHTNGGFDGCVGSIGPEASGLPLDVCVSSPQGCDAALKLDGRRTKTLYRRAQVGSPSQSARQIIPHSFGIDMSLMPCLPFVSVAFGLYRPTRKWASWKRHSKISVSA
jgi:hypothetical protein